MAVPIAITFGESIGITEHPGPNVSIAQITIVIGERASIGISVGPSPTVIIDTGLTLSITERASIGLSNFPPSVEIVGPPLGVHVMAIFLANVELQIPRQGMLALASAMMQRICSTAPVQVNAKLMLFQAAVDIQPVTILADLVAADFDGYAPITLNLAGDCDGFIEGPAIGVDSEVRLVVDQQIFMMNPTAVIPNSIWGVAMYADFGSGDILIGLSQFLDGPYPISAVGDAVKVSAELILRSQLILA